MITWHQWALLYRAKCITEIPENKSPKHICLVSSEIWGVGIISEAAGSPPAGVKSGRYSEEIIAQRSKCPSVSGGDFGNRKWISLNKKSRADL